MFDEIRSRVEAALEALEAYAEQGIESIDGQKAPRLGAWGFFLDPGEAVCLVGHASGHPTLPHRPTDNDAGRRIGTSPVLLITPGAEFARTLSRWYRLGTFCLDVEGTGDRPYGVARDTHRRLRDHYESIDPKDVVASLRATLGSLPAETRGLH